MVRRFCRALGGFWRRQRMPDGMAKTHLIEKIDLDELVELLDIGRFSASPEHGFYAL